MLNLTRPSSGNSSAQSSQQLPNEIDSFDAPTRDLLLYYRAKCMGFEAERAVWVRRLADLEVLSATMTRGQSSTTMAGDDATAKRTEHELRLRLEEEREKVRKLIAYEKHCQHNLVKYYVRTSTTITTPTACRICACKSLSMNWRPSFSWRAEPACLHQYVSQHSIDWWHHTTSCRCNRGTHRSPMPFHAGCNNNCERCEHNPIIFCVVAIGAGCCNASDSE